MVFVNVWEPCMQIFVQIELCRVETRRVYLRPNQLMRDAHRALLELLTRVVDQSDRSDIHKTIMK